jgi:hypothetical protein
MFRCGLHRELRGLHRELLSHFRSVLRKGPPDEKLEAQKAAVKGHAAKLEEKLQTLVLPGSMVCFLT